MSPVSSSDSIRGLELREPPYGQLFSAALWVFGLVSLAKSPAARGSWLIVVGVMILGTLVLWLRRFNPRRVMLRVEANGVSLLGSNWTTGLMTIPWSAVEAIYLGPSADTRNAFVILAHREALPPAERGTVDLLHHYSLNRLKLAPAYVLLGTNHGLRRRAAVYLSLIPVVPPGKLFVYSDRPIPHQEWLPSRVLANSIQS